jgi:hypothetical protein
MAESKSESYITTDSQSASLSWNKVKFNIRVTLRMAVNRQSVHRGVKPLETHDQTFFQVNSCGNSPYVTSSLTRKWICLLWICTRLGAYIAFRYPLFNTRILGNGLTLSDELSLFSNLLPIDRHPVDSVDMEIVCCHWNFFVNIRCRGNRC